MIEHSYRSLFLLVGAALAVLGCGSSGAHGQPRGSFGAGDFERVKYNNQTAVVDLGVGLWAWPLPLDHDEDGDMDLLVSSPDTPFNGVYVFENPSGKAFPVFAPPERLADAIENVQLSYVSGAPKVVNGAPRVLVPGALLEDFSRSLGEKRRALYASDAALEDIEDNRFNQWKLVDFELVERLRNGSSFQNKLPAHFVVNTDMQKTCALASLALASLLVALVSTPHASRAQQGPHDVQHVRVYSEEGRFAGWPANLGIWSWENEILVGFVEADYRNEGGFHDYDQSTAQDLFARSKDGGLTWTIENAYAHGQTAARYNNRLGDKAEEPSALSEAIDFTHPDFALTFQRQTNDIGPSHFYYSYNRGEQWRGPFALPNLGTPGIATRTDYLVSGQRELLAFFTVAKSNEKEGRVLVARTTDGAQSWRRHAWIGPEPEGFEIMPSSVRLSPSDILTVIRRRESSGKSLLASYLSQDNGRSWQRLTDPVSSTGDGGSPPALVEMQDGRLALAYAVRSENGSRIAVKVSSDGGRTWSDETVLRADGASGDIGYPRMVQRPDGKLVVVYYWNNELLEDRAPNRYIAATIFDPAAIFGSSSEADSRVE